MGVKVSKIRPNPRILLSGYVFELFNVHNIFLSALWLISSHSSVIINCYHVTDSKSLILEKGTVHEMVGKKLIVSL